MGDGSPASVLVRSEVFGGAADEEEIPEVSLEALDEELPLRELIRRVVEEQGARAPGKQALGGAG